MARKSMNGKGESPTLRVRMDQRLINEARAKARRDGVALPDVVRQLLAWWTTQGSG